MIRIQKENISHIKGLTDWKKIKKMTEAEIMAHACIMDNDLNNLRKAKKGSISNFPKKIR